MSHEPDLDALIRRAFEHEPLLDPWSAELHGKCISPDRLWSVALGRSAQTVVERKHLARCEQCKKHERAVREAVGTRPLEDENPVAAPAEGIDERGPPTEQSEEAKGTVSQEARVDLRFILKELAACLVLFVLGWLVDLLDRAGGNVPPGVMQASLGFSFSAAATIATLGFCGLAVRQLQAHGIGKSSIWVRKLGRLLDSATLKRVLWTLLLALGGFLLALLVSIVFRL